jgi:hypothetical protein
MKAIKFNTAISSDKIQLPAGAILLFDKSLDHTFLTADGFLTQVITCLYENESNLTDEHIIGDVYDLLDIDFYLFAKSISDKKASVEPAISKLLLTEIKSKYGEVAEVVTI